MLFGAISGRVSNLVVTGVMGAAAFDVLKRVAGRVNTHEVAVVGTAWGLRGMRASEVRAEQTRLKVADVVAEARARIGEQSLPPAASGEHPHEHG